MTTLGLEKNFQSSVLEYLNGLPGCRAENVSGNASQSGRPDINGCFNGRMFKLELKTTDNRYKPSKKQKLELRRWKNAGCVVGVVYTMEVVCKLFEETNWNMQYNYTFEKTEIGDCVSWFTIPKRVIDADKWI